jgi:ABC-type polysaccharide/polyol phosphate export permease
MLEGQLPSLGGFAYSFGISIILLVVGLTLFRRAETAFAERL